MARQPESGRDAKPVGEVVGDVERHHVRRVFPGQLVEAHRDELDIGRGPHTQSEGKPITRPRSCNGNRSVTIAMTTEPTTPPKSPVTIRPSIST